MSVPLIYIQLLEIITRYVLLSVRFFYVTGIILRIVSNSQHYFFDSSCIPISKIDACSEYRLVFLPRNFVYYLGF